MDSILLTIHPQDPLWLIIAFLCGLLATLLKLPPLVGFLIAGFILNVFGVKESEFLRITADLGITLLLFTLGLKLKLRSLLAKEVWGVAASHLVIMTLTMAGFLAILHLIFEFKFDTPTAFLLGFALSFSSTVFAVKVLDEMGAASTRHSNVSIGVLIVQDIAAVAFLAISAGKWPSPWALALALLIPLRHFLHFLLDRSGHGELLLLFGMTLAVGGADLFEYVDIKGDLGALIIGILFSGHPKSEELSKGLLGFKNLFLVGFFLTVGMTALPGLQELLIAICILMVLPLKTVLYFILFSIFGLRSRTSWQSSLNLANFSEFGLIVSAIAMANGWLSPSWMAVFAIVLSFSFIISAPLATGGDDLYNRWNHLFKRFNQELADPPLKQAIPPEARLLVIGMGRVGTSIYEYIEEHLPNQVLGLDTDETKNQEHCSAKRQVIIGDGTNPDFWLQNHQLLGQIHWVILALPSPQANVSAAQRLRENHYTGQVAATIRYEDEAPPLIDQGVVFAFDIHGEAGRGFAADFLKRIDALAT
ncbi:cation:proton antiporter family protein [Pseudobacteriovorax antillogorgiicola]|uniref:Transporter, CPA2 family n=1 Tax=Pseudobacteriovorax antillogorgiicola TaxID=1513793 RepID=A0A1Y6B9B9_9BACT|nr:cation:proton antiporter family protein [Pseudobacteriovorax antillogorgiicola]TCS57560.1 transporter (CPA2 family) [Pseudobacteriovorax antillogorgiicola]SME99775.1 transporter, CPA2 family [Pseudobacteriovorax antillogorgiicola]